MANLTTFQSEARGKPGGAVASITLDQTDPHIGDTVTFTVSGGKRITVSCFQGGLGNGVYSADQSIGTSFQLISPNWLSTGENAVCYAWLYNRNLGNGALATAIFSVISAPR